MYYEYMSVHTTSILYLHSITLQESMIESKWPSEMNCCNAPEFGMAGWGSNPLPVAPQRRSNYHCATRAPHTVIRNLYPRLYNCGSRFAAFKSPHYPEPKNLVNKEYSLQNLLKMSSIWIDLKTISIYRMLVRRSTLSTHCL